MAGSPFVDFAIWGPFNHRVMKQRSFNAMVMNNKGEFVTKPMKGPTSYDDWLVCWKVFRAAAVMLGAQRSVPWMHIKRTFAI